MNKMLFQPYSFYEADFTSWRLGADVFKRQKHYQLAKRLHKKYVVNFINANLTSCARAFVTTS